MFIAAPVAVVHAQFKDADSGVTIAIFQPWMGRGYVLRQEPSRMVATITSVIVMALAWGGYVPAQSGRRVHPRSTNPPPEISKAGPLRKRKTLRLSRVTRTRNVVGQPPIRKWRPAESCTGSGERLAE